MPGKHNNKTISFRPSAWERTLIEQRAIVSGMYKKDFITQSCINSHIIIEDSKEAIRRIVDTIHDMQIDLKEIAGQIQSGNFMLSNIGYQEMKQDYLAFLLTLIDILNDVSYLFKKQPPSACRNWKAELELEQLKSALEYRQNEKIQWKKKIKLVWVVNGRYFKYNELESYRIFSERKLPGEK